MKVLPTLEQCYLTHAFSRSTPLSLGASLSPQRNTDHFCAALNSDHINLGVLWYLLLCHGNFVKLLGQIVHAFLELCALSIRPLPPDTLVDLAF